MIDSINRLIGCINRLTNRINRLIDSINQFITGIKIGYQFINQLFMALVGQLFAG